MENFWKIGALDLGDFAHTTVSTCIARGDVQEQGAVQLITLRRPDHFWTGGAINGELLEDRRARVGRFRAYYCLDL